MEHVSRPVFLVLGSLALMQLSCRTPPLLPPPPDQRSIASDPEFYRSSYLGRSVAHPARISGVWEASDGHGGVIGIDLQLQTYLRGKALAPLDGETWQSLTVGIFETSSSTPLFGEEHFFSDSKQGGSVRYDHRHLVLHVDAKDLDLTLQLDGNWTGRFHSGAIDTTVTLVQFGSLIRKGHGLRGTWRSGTAGDYTCLHIAEPVPGSITGWQDLFQNNDAVRFAPQIQRPATSLESYGNRFSVRPTVNRGLILESPPSIAGCCANSSTASLKRGVLNLCPVPECIAARSLTGVRWRRMPGHTCAPPPDPPATSACKTRCAALPVTRVPRAFLHQPATSRMRPPSANAATLSSPVQ